MKSGPIFDFFGKKNSANIIRNQYREWRLYFLYQLKSCIFLTLIARNRRECTTQIAFLKKLKKTFLNNTLITYIAER